MQALLGAGVPIVVLPEKLPFELFKSSELTPLVRIESTHKVFQGPDGAAVLAMTTQIVGGYNVPKGWDLGAEIISGFSRQCADSEKGADRRRKWVRG